MLTFAVTEVDKSGETDSLQPSSYAHVASPGMVTHLKDWSSERAGGWPKNSASSSSWNSKQILLRTYHMYWMHITVQPKDLNMFFMKASHSRYFRQFNEIDRIEHPFFHYPVRKQPRRTQLSAIKQVWMCSEPKSFTSERNLRSPDNWQRSEPTSCNFRSP